jgi:hypothetical protein
MRARMLSNAAELTLPLWRKVTKNI